MILIKGVEKYMNIDKIAEEYETIFMKMGWKWVDGINTNDNRAMGAPTIIHNFRRPNRFQVRSLTLPAQGAINMFNKLSHVMINIANVGARAKPVIVGSSRPSASNCRSNSGFAAQTTAPSLVFLCA